METITDVDRILEKAAHRDSTLRGLGAGTTPLSLAGRAYIRGLLDHLVRHLTREEITQLRAWCMAEGNLYLTPPCVFQVSDRTGQNTYYVYSDHSFYFSSTGESEVWDCPGDFADHNIEPFGARLDEMDDALLRYLGGRYAVLADQRAALPPD